MSNIQLLESREPLALTGHCLIARIAAHAASSPSRLALADAVNHITFGELESRSNAVAARLLQAGVKQDDCVALLFDRVVDFVVAALGAMKAGGAYLPLDSSTPSDRVVTILTDSKAPVLLTHRGKGQGIRGATWRVLEIETAAELQNGDHPVLADLLDADPARLAYVIYTSGSTGKPKGVEITHANLLNLIDWHNSAFDVTAEDRASQVAGFAFDAAGWEIWPHLAIGASVHIADEITRRSPAAMLEWLVSQEITIAFMPTVMAEQLVHATWPAQTKLRTMLAGADMLHRRPSAGLPFTLVNNYGPTECTVVATSGIVSPDASGEPDGAPSIGKPISNTTALILDDSLKPVPLGEPGELCLAGAHVGRGYRNLPEMTASRFVEIPGENGSLLRIYRSGDRARFLPNGEIAFLGRLDDQVKIRGYRVELGEITAALDRYPGLDAAVVLARPVDQGLELVAYLVLARDAKITALDLREFLSARLPDYMVPAKFVSLPAFPVTTNGKLDRTALPAPDANNLLASGSTAAATPAADGIEGRVGELVAGLLGQSNVAREDNFFMLGGHSMLGVQLVAKIRDTFGVKLTLRQLFGAPTVAALSAEVGRLVATKT